MISSNESLSAGLYSPALRGAANMKVTELRFLVAKLQSSLQKLHDHHHDLVNRYIISMEQSTLDILRLS